MTSSTSRTVSRLFLIAAALLFSTGGAAIKAAGVTAWQVACFRCAVAAVALYAFLPGARKGWSPRVWTVGTAYAGTLLLFALANRMTTSANAIFLQSTAPLYLLLLAPWLLRERIHKGDVILMGALAVGMSLFFAGSERPLATAPRPALGNVLAVASGVTWALTVAGLRWLGRAGQERNQALPTVLAGNVLAFAIALPMALPVSGIGARDVLVLGYLGVFQIGLAYVCLTRGLRDVPAFEASTIMLVEPAVNPIWAWLVHGESPGALALAGGGIILLATAVNSWWRATLNGDPSRAVSSAG